MSAIKFIQSYATKSLTKNQGSGIINLPGAMQSEARAGEIVALLQRAGISMNQLDDYIRSEADVAKFVNIIEAASKPKVYSGQAAVDQLNKLFPKKGEVVQFPQKTSFKEQVEAMKKSGDIVNPNNLKKNDKVLERDLFKNSNLNETDAQIKARLEAGNKKSSTNIKNNRQLTDEEIRDYELDLGDSETWLNKGTFGEAEQALKNQKAYEAKMFAEYKSIGGSKRPDGPNASKKDSLPIRLMKNFEKELNEADLMAEGYSKDQANVLIKARQKMISGEEMNPNESLLRVKEEFADKAGVDVEDFTDIDFEIDIPDYAKGGRAGFYTGGITDVEPSLDDIGHGADAMNARTRLMSPGNQATTSTGLNYLLAEDNDNMRIPFAGGGDPKRRAFLKLLATLTGGAAAFKSGLLSLGEGGTKKAVTETVKQAAGSGGQVPPYFLNLVKKIKTMGDDVTAVLAYKDKQKVTKYKDYELTEDLATGEQTIQRMKVLDDGSEAYYGQPLTEETYMSYKPGKGQADETMKGKTPPDEYEEGTALLRSDRQYAGEVVDESATISDDVIKEGTIFEDTLSEFGKAEGGRIGLFLGGGATAGKGLAREMLKFMTKGSSNAKSPAEILKMMNPKQFEKLLDNPAMLGKISPQTGQSANEMIVEMIKKTKDDRSSMVGDLIGSARKIKKVDDSVIAYKKKIIKDMIDGGIDEDTAYAFAEKMAKEMKEAAAPQLTASPPKITEQGLLELENIQKNLLTKGRKLQATGGLTTMLGE